MNFGAITLPVRGCVSSAGAFDVNILGAVLLLASPPSIGSERYFTRLKNAAMLVVIVLRPALERMVVALGALHADAEEELGGGFRSEVGSRETR